MDCPYERSPGVLELVYTAILVLVFLLLASFSFYVVYRLYRGHLA